MSLISSIPSIITNRVKPHKAEAILRLRTNSICLAAALVVSYLLPGSVPSLPTALRTVVYTFKETRYQLSPGEWTWVGICAVEMALFTLLGLNILQAAHAIKYPRAPLPHMTSPAKAKPKAPASSAATPKRPFKVLSPNSSPQPQKAFAFTPSASTSLTSASIALSASSRPSNANGNGASTSAPYAQSPLSTPSRVLHYTVPPSSSATSTAMSTSTAEYLATPSPVISAYRGKHNHAGGDVGRALDGSYLLRILPDEVLDD